MPEPVRMPFVIESGRRRASVIENDDDVAITVGVPFDQRGMILSPAQAVSYAGQLLAAASNVLDRRFQRRVGSP